MPSRRGQNAAGRPPARGRVDDFQDGNEFKSEGPSGPACRGAPRLLLAQRIDGTDRPGVPKTGRRRLVRLDEPRPRTHGPELVTRVALRHEANYRAAAGAHASGRTLSAITRSTAPFLLEARPGDPAGAKRVARALGYLPLALSHAAAYCAEGTSLADYPEVLDALPAQQLFDSSPEVSYTQTVASTWKASIQAASAGTARRRTAGARRGISPRTRSRARCLTS